MRSASGSEELRARQRLDRLVRAEQVWGSAEHFDELTDAMTRYLVGEFDATPAHHGPPDEETEELTEYLIRFNRGGFLTTNSQPTIESPNPQLAFLEGFAREPLALRLGSMASAGTLCVCLTPLGGAGTRTPYGHPHPFIEGHPSPRWMAEVWGQALSASAFRELLTCWHVVVFDTNDRDSWRLWRNVLEVIEGPTPGWHRLFEVAPLSTEPPWPRS